MVVEWLATAPPDTPPHPPNPQAPFFRTQSLVVKKNSVPFPSLSFLNLIRRLKISCRDSRWVQCTCTTHAHTAAKSRKRELEEKAAAFDHGREGDRQCTNVLSHTATAVRRRHRPVTDLQAPQNGASQVTHGWAKPPTHKSQMVTGDNSYRRTTMSENASPW